VGLDFPVTIRLATTREVPEVIRLERRCLPAAHWSEQQYEELFRTGEDAIGRLALIAVSTTSNDPQYAGKEILGFLVARHLAPEWELENIVVAPETRGKGVGARLLEELLARAKQTNSDSVYLEVRESNLAARALYGKCGFQEAGRRKSYYANPSEDAVLYCKKLLPRPISE